EEEIEGETAVGAAGGVERFFTREDLIRAVVALEVLGPPGGRWRFFPSGSGQKIDGT
ncbi:MAG: hypothetical protein GX493_06485, partial [Firmicutes bacterium]|nr:hypothetical protein [Bacillota bacterium]